ncbi:MAG: sugar phosphate isomerase/epimerase [Planctomycetales bacterium]|nr:sugar phosphate isomerase/epimerase [Planctomycetales bacterium]
MDKQKLVHRRQLLALLGIPLASVASSTPGSLACRIFSQEAENKNFDTLDFEGCEHWYKSLKWNMVRFEGSLLQKFESLKEIGFDGVELDSPGDIPAHDALHASRQSGLPIEGIVNSTHWNIRHSDPDSSVRQVARRNMITAMRFARDVGANSVLLVPGKVTDTENENHDQVWRRSVDDIHTLLPLAEELEIQILIENVGNGFCESPEMFASYIDAIDSPWVGIHFDIGNHIRFGPPADWIRKLNRRIKKLDVKDRTRDNLRTLIGDGHADWSAVRAALREIKYQGWAAAEVPGGDQTRLQEVLRRMNAVLGKSDGNPLFLDL